jgi:hypothetical protein
VCSIGLQDSSIFGYSFYSLRYCPYPHENGLTSITPTLGRRSNPPLLYKLNAIPLCSKVGGEVRNGLVDFRSPSLCFRTGQRKSDEECLTPECLLCGLWNWLAEISNRIRRDRAAAVRRATSDARGQARFCRLSFCGGFETFVEISDGIARD